MASSHPPMEVHRDAGEGPAVVLVHGFPDTADSWDGIATAVQHAGHRVVVPHLRGYTRTSIRPGRPYDLRTLAEDLLALLDHVGLDQAVVVGHDWGAIMGFGAASLAPDRVRGLVTIAIPHPRTVTPTPSLAWGARHLLMLKLPGAATWMRRSGMAGVEDLYDRWSPGWSGQERQARIRAVKEAFADPAVLDAALAYYRALGPRIDRALVQRLPMPALVVGGDQDVVPPRMFDGSRSAFTGRFESLVLEGAGHWAHLEREQAFTDALLRFLASLDPDGPA